MTQIPRALRPAAPARPAPSLFDVLGALGPVPSRTDDPRTEASAPFRAALVLEVARRNRPSGPPRPTPHGAAPPARVS
jgi:hypothetical protein